MDKSNTPNIDKLAGLVGGAPEQVGTSAMAEAVKEVQEAQAEAAKNIAKDVLTQCASLASDAKKLEQDTIKKVSEIDGKIGEHLDALKAITSDATTPAPAPAAS